MRLTSACVFVVALAALFDLNMTNWVTDKITRKRYICQRVREDISSDGLTRAETQKECKIIGGFLPEPKNKHENDFIKKMLSKHVTWLGMTIQTNVIPRVWKWHDGTKVEWFNWDYLKNNHLSDPVNCVLIGGDGYWTSSHSCTTWTYDGQHFLCEKGADKICTLPHASNSRELDSLPGGKGQVLCDTVTDGGGWIVIQRRVTGNVLFNRTWNTYTGGFGFVGGDFWIGLENIHRLCPTNCSFRYEFAFNGKDYFSQYRDFSLSGAADKYRLRLEGLVAGNTLVDDLLYNSEVTVSLQRFTTWDADHDNYDDGNCAVEQGGAGWWWSECGWVNPNGQWASSEGHGMFWLTVTWPQSATSTELKLRVGPGADWSRVDTRPITGAAKNKDDWRPIHFAGVTPVDGEPTTIPAAAAVTASTPPTEADEPTGDPNGAQCNTGSLPGLALCVMAALLILA